MSRMILLIEDNPDDAELTRLALERLKKGAQVVHLTDGAQALDFLGDATRAAQVRFIILDVKLPKVDGMEVLAKLKSDARTRSIPVVVLSSSSRDSEIARCFASGANSYVVKPVELEAYLDKVSTLGRYWDDINHPQAAR
jgi:two-component system response regulator